MSFFLCCSSIYLSIYLSCLLLHQVWVEPWRVSVCAPVRRGHPPMWVGAAVMEAVRVVVDPPAQGRCVAADVMGSKTSTWTLSSQRRWHCIWTLQALPLPEEEEPGNETPPSVVMSSQTPLLTNATGWSDVLPAYVCEGVGGGGEPSKPRLGEGDGWAYVDRCADGQTDVRIPDCAKESGLKMGTEGSQISLLKCWMNLFLVSFPYTSTILVLQITDLQSKHCVQVCVWLIGRSGRHPHTPQTSLPWKGDNRGRHRLILGHRQFSVGWKCTVLL